MIKKVTAFTEGCEEITEELTRSAGIIVTKITPLLAPVASGLCTLFAFYDGGGRMLTGKVSNPYTISFWAGMVLFIVVEGINFAATFTRDRGEKLKGTHEHELSFLKLDSLVVWCFVLTLATVAMLETAPGLAAWYYGEITGSDLGFRIGILILPFFSKMGANIFSVSMLLDSLEGTSALRRQRRLQGKREEAELEIELDKKRKRADMELKQLEAEFLQKLEIERSKAESKIIQKSVKPDVAKDVAGSVASDKDTPVQHDSATSRRNALLDMLQQFGDIGPSSFGEKLNVDRTTIHRDFKAMEKDGLVHLNGNGWTPGRKT